jgi:CheY-like chemotaxis protein
MRHEQAPILMAEDDEDDRMLIQEAIQESNLANPIQFVSNGEELLDYLYQRGVYEQGRPPEPGLILLDLNMPKMDGKTALRKIKTDPDLKHIPVAVLTTSDQKQEALECYNLGANSYIVKPGKFERLVQVMRTLGEYWFSIVKLAK